MSDRTAYRDQLVTAIMAAIVERSTAGGVTTIPAREAGEALLIALAGMITGTQATRTPKALRETCEAFARDLRNQVRHMQEIYERTGERLIDAEPVLPS
jgi:hypothetical protein